MFHYSSGKTLAHESKIEEAEGVLYFLGTKRVPIILSVYFFFFIYKGGPFLNISVFVVEDISLVIVILVVVALVEWVGYRV